MPSEFDKQQDVLTRALHIYNQRTEKYGDAWRASGARGQASRARDKAQRFMNNVNRGRTADAIDVEDALDAINHLVFAVRAVEERNLDGNVEGVKISTFFCCHAPDGLVNAPFDMRCILNEGHDHSHIGRDASGHIWTWR